MDDRRYYIDKAKELLEEKDRGDITNTQALGAIDGFGITTEDLETAEGELYTDA